MSRKGEDKMVFALKNLLKVVLSVTLIFLFGFRSHAFAVSGSEPWSLRGNFVWIPADDDFEPIDNLFGASFGLLCDIGSNFRVGGEIQWVTGDEDSDSTDWGALFAVGEFSFLDRSVNDYEIYAHLGLGFIYIDVDGVSNKGDNTSVAIRPAIGSDLFITEHVALNLQVGYLFSEVTLGGKALDSEGFEGKIGLTVAF